MEFQRKSGILLHPTSLPGPHGIGDLGDSAYAFLDFLSASKQGIWQVLPLGPTGYGDSPYQCVSSFAGNPLLISLDRLVPLGLLSEEEAAPDEDLPEDRVSYGAVIDFKTQRLQKAYNQFRAAPTRQHPLLHRLFDEFCLSQADWLEDYALYMALKAEHGLQCWVNWHPNLVRRKPEDLALARERLKEAIDYYRFVQWLFFQQWQDLRHEARSRGIQIVGDIPIFVAYDSADVWANQHLFYLDENGYQTVVAGVPPDYFSATGQRWGNPLYRWDVMAQDGYQWWIRRVRATLELVDITRIDHFRGLEAYWEIPAWEPTAMNGQWVKGPGAAFFEAMQKALGNNLPFIAEDLGVITQEVNDLREQFGLPGMRILQFAFGSDTSANHFLPHCYDRNSVVYTGTHDNETIVGWFSRSDTSGTTDDLETVLRERHRAKRYADVENPAQAHWDFIRLAWMSVANFAIAPVQDILGLGNEARMNNPAGGSDNWQWRLRSGLLSEDIAIRLAELTELYGRAGNSGCA